MKNLITKKTNNIDVRYLAILKFIWRIIKKTRYNITVDKIEKTLKTNEKFLFIGSITLNILLIYKISTILSLSLGAYVLAPLGFFVCKALTQIIKEEGFKLRYYKITKMFNGDVAVINKEREDKNEVYIINSFAHKGDLVKKKNTLEQYLNTNILSIEQDEYNKRLIRIITNKNTKFIKTSDMTEKLTNLLVLDGFTPSHIKTIENDFSTSIYYKIDEPIKAIESKIKDIAFKMDKNITLRLDAGYYLFEIKANNTKTYDLQDYIAKANKKDMILPFIFGVQHKDGSLMTLDLTKTLHTFINGISGSGKSCLFNSLAQSLMVYNNNVSFIMADFKFVELAQYKDFKNTVFTSDMEEFNLLLSCAINEMDNRYADMATIGAKKLSVYNAKTGKNVPYLIVCIDECASIKDKKMWDKLTDIVKRGRACGIIVVASTQYPNSDSIDVNFRSQVGSKLVGKLNRQHEAKVAGIETNYDVTNFNIGEFIINCNSHNNTKFQGLFIDDEVEGKNNVYDKLNSILGNDSIGHNIDLGITIKTPSNQVISLVSRISRLLKKEENIPQIDISKGEVTIKNDDLYMSCLFYLHKRGTDIMPTQAMLLYELKTTDKRLRKCKDKLVESKVLYKPNQTTFRINLEELKKEIDRYEKT